MFQYAVGLPGHPIRNYFSAAPNLVSQQLREGEVMIQTEIRGFAMISEDGTTVYPLPQG